MQYKALIGLLSKLGDVSYYESRLDGDRLLRADIALHSLYVHCVGRYRFNEHVVYRWYSPAHACREDLDIVVFRGGRGIKHRFVVDDMIFRRDLEYPNCGILSRHWGDEAVAWFVRLFDQSDTLMFNTVPYRSGGRDLYSWNLLYLDLDHLDISVEDLLCFDEAQVGSCWYIPRDRGFTFPRAAHRALSRAWRKIYDAYCGDEEILSLLYYDALWYHTGRHMHVALAGYWHQVDRDVIERLRSRLRSDAAQTVHPLMKVRLAGSINPKSGDIALGYFHPFAVPYYDCFFSGDSVGKRISLLFDQYGLMRADEECWRPRAPRPVTEADLVDNGYPEHHSYSSRLTDDMHSRTVRKHRVSPDIRWNSFDLADVSKHLSDGLPIPAHLLAAEDDHAEIVTVWHWKIQFEAAPYGRECLKRLGDVSLKLEEDSEGRLSVKDLYSLELPSWVKRGNRASYRRNFKAFTVSLQRVEISSRLLESTTLVDAGSIERALGTGVLLELEWGVSRAVRSSNRMSDLLAFVWLNHLKRIEYQYGLVPKHRAFEYLVENIGWSESNVRLRIRRLLKSGWLTERRSGYIVHSWDYIARLMNVPCEKLFMVNAEELKSTTGLKSVLVSIPGTFKQPVIKYEIGKSLGINVSTVKRNRRGRLRAWHRVRFVSTYSSFREADEARQRVLHPVHFWPLVLCGYRMMPAKAGKKQWVLLRSSAASVLDLVVVQRCGKSKRLRRLTAHLANMGSGIGSGVETFKPYQEQRYTNFTDSPQFYQDMAEQFQSRIESPETAEQFPRGMESLEERIRRFVSDVFD